MTAPTWWWRIRARLSLRTSLIRDIEQLRDANTALREAVAATDDGLASYRDDARAARADAENAERLRQEAVAERDAAMARHHADAAQLHRRLNAIHDLSGDPRIPDDLRAEIRAQTRPFERQEAARA